ncbi:hypothetical protein G5B10_11730 [Fluviicola sp. SGL-29]|nr:hypothetical protein [Fluviicola sp. SGL-29]
MKSRKLFIGAMLILMAIVSCKKENPEPNNPPKSGEEQENPIDGDTIPTGTNIIGFLVCAGGTGNTGSNHIYFNDLDSIVLRKLEQNTQTLEYTELGKITVLPSDFITQSNLLNFTSNDINQNVLSQLVNTGGYNVEMTIYLSVPLSHIYVAQNGITNRRLSIHNISSGTYSPCQATSNLYRGSLGNDSNRCKLFRIL